MPFPDAQYPKGDPTWAEAHQVVVEALAEEQAENMRLRSEVSRLLLHSVGLRSEVERLRLENERLYPDDLGGFCCTPMQLSARCKELAERLAKQGSEVERLRLTPDEILSVKCAESVLSELPDGKHHADLLWTLLARLRGGE